MEIPTGRWGFVNNFLWYALMPVGLHINNSSSSASVQIDSDAHNLRLVASGSIHVTKFNRSNNTNDTPPIQVAGDSPLLFLGPASGHVAVIRRSQEGGVWNFYLATGPWEDVTVEYYIFDRRTPVAGSYGLQVFTASGELAFDSNDKHLRLAGIYPGNSNVTGLPTGKTYATCLSFPTVGFYTFTDTPFYQSYLLFSSTRVLGTTVEIDASEVGIAPFEAEQEADATTFYEAQKLNNSRILIADVTGF